MRDGVVKGRQRYRCKVCNFRSTVQHCGKSPEVKRQVLELYLEGLGFPFYRPVSGMQSYLRLQLDQSVRYGDERASFRLDAESCGDG